MSWTRNTPYIITIGRWDTPTTVGGTPEGQYAVMLKMEPFQVRSCPASLPQILTKQGFGDFVEWEVVTAKVPALPMDNRSTQAPYRPLEISLSILEAIPIRSVER